MFRWVQFDAIAPSTLPGAERFDRSPVLERDLKSKFVVGIITQEIQAQYSAMTEPMRLNGEALLRPSEVLAGLRIYFGVMPTVAECELIVVYIHQYFTFADFNELLQSELLFSKPMN